MRIPEREGDEVGLAYKVIGRTSALNAGVKCEYPIVLIPIRELRPHEETVPERVRDLIKSLVEEGVQIRPILVDAKTMVILDGHHRVEALKRLGAKFIAAIMVDYDDEDCINVGSWREGWRVTKKLVRETGLKGERLPPRTSRHIPRFKIPEVRVPLSELMERA